VKSVVSNSEFKLGIDMGEITVRLPLGQQIRQPGQETAVLQEAIAKCGDYDYYFQKDCSCYRGIARHWTRHRIGIGESWRSYDDSLRTQRIGSEGLTKTRQTAARPILYPLIWLPQTGLRNSPNKLRSLPVPTWIFWLPTPGSPK
jgi:hypothetical protein